MILIFVHVFQTLKKEENNSQVGVVFKESLLTEKGKKVLFGRGMKERIKINILFV